MESVYEALERALEECTSEAWDRVDSMAYKEVCKDCFDIQKLEEMLSFALKRRGYDPENECNDESEWIDHLIAKALSHIEKCKTMRVHFLGFDTIMHSIDRTGHLVAVTRPWLDMMGYEIDAVLGRLSSDFLTEESRHRAKTVALPAFWRDGVLQCYPYQMVTAGGEVIDVLFDAICARDDAGMPTNSICLIRKVPPI